jgi:2-keto-4-pentenoate hydratase/2-oxohepta-3-ene-1,7-dioic acid hydratase in catechol pathway
MRIARFQSGGNIQYGLVEGDSIRPIRGDLFGDRTPTGDSVSLSSVKLLAPVVPNIMLAVALNYPSHLQAPPSPRPELFVKSNNTLADPDDEIPLPAGCERIDYEGEMVAVIGRTCSRVSTEEALDYVFGYTIGNDVSARDWQRGDHQWFRGKGCDKFGPLGPWIETDIDPTNTWLSTLLNGEEVQRCNTGEMINTVAETISFISRVCTLQPGDVIFTGTSGRPQALKPGDVVEVNVEGIGTLRNTFIADPKPMVWVDTREDPRPAAAAAAARPTIDQQARL